MLLHLSYFESGDNEDEDDEFAIFDVNRNNNNVELGFGDQLKSHWENVVPKLDHDMALTAYFCCVLPEVRADAKSQRYNGELRDAVERQIKRLHAEPNPNPKVDTSKKSMDQIINIFWKEWGAFMDQTKPFDKKGRFTVSDAIEGRSHIWHETYSVPYTDVFGFVACRTTSKVAGIGACEREWGNVKQINIGKRCNISGSSLEKRAILYTTARMEEARNRREAMEKIDAAGPNAMFGDDDLA